MSDSDDNRSADVPAHEDVRQVDSTPPAHSHDRVDDYSSHRSDRVHHEQGEELDAGNEDVEDEVEIKKTGLGTRIYNGINSVLSGRIFDEIDNRVPTLPTVEALGHAVIGGIPSSDPIEALANIGENPGIIKVAFDQAVKNVTGAFGGNVDLPNNQSKTPHLKL